MQDQQHEERVREGVAPGERFTGQPIADGASIASPAPRRRIASRQPWVSVVVLITGLMVLLPVMGTSVTGTVANVTGTSSFSFSSFGGIVGFTAPPREMTLPVDGVERVEVDTGAGHLKIAFGATSPAQDAPGATATPSARPSDAGQGAGAGQDAAASAHFSEYGPGSAWGVERQGSVLVLRGGFRAAELTLPEQLRGVDLRINNGAGLAEVEGDFGAVEAIVSTGSLDVRGDAASFSAEVGAGTLDYRGSVPGKVNLSVSTGSMDARIEGKQPSSIDVRVAVGSADVRVPAGPYRIDDTVDVGSFDSRVDEDSSSKHVITVNVDTGSLTLEES